MRIALDTLGGQFAPEAILEGAALAAQRSEDPTFLLIGDPGALSNLIDRLKLDRARFSILEATEFIAEDESPVAALKSKPKASILLALEAHKRGQADAVVSAGSTGAQIVASIHILDLLEGVKRPAIGSYFPTRSGRTFLIDVGANVSCRPIHLAQFAVMGALFRQYLDGLASPRVALLSTGEESSKGNHVTREAYELMTLIPELNFIGSVEGRDLYSGKADVIVCDGFTGNVLLKFAESLPEILTHSAQNVSAESVLDPAILTHLAQSFDYQEFGGVPLLGVNGVSIICHGHSSPKAIASAIGEAIRMVNLQINQHIHAQINTIGQWSASIRTKALIGRWRRRSAGEKH